MILICLKSLALSLKMLLGAVEPDEYFLSDIENLSNPVDIFQMFLSF